MSLYSYCKSSRVARLHVRLRPGGIIGYDNCPVPRGLAVMLDDARHHGARFQVISCDRRRGVAEKFGKKSQAFLYNAWIAWRDHGRLVPPFTRGAPPNPANPPGRSTHEWRSDGVPYRGPVGRKIKWWGVGWDLRSGEEAQHLINTLHVLGYAAFRPYPSASEAHHGNMRHDPMPNLKRRGLA